MVISPDLLLHVQSFIEADPYQVTLDQLNLAKASLSLAAGEYTDHKDAFENYNRMSLEAVRGQLGIRSVLLGEDDSQEGQLMKFTTIRQLQVLAQPLLALISGSK